MSNDVPVQVIVAAFQDEDSAKEAYKELKEAKKEHLISIENAAVIRMDENGKLHIKEAHDMGGGKGAGIGALVGGAIGLLGGPVGVVAGGALGALVGGLAAGLHDAGFSDDRLKEIGDSLQPGTSAIIAVVRHEWVNDVRDALAEEATDVMTADLSEQIAGALTEGKDYGFSLLATDDAVVVGEVAADESELEGERLIVTDEGIVVESVVAEAEEEVEEIEVDEA